VFCKNPYIKAGVPYPCGKCIPCLVSRRRLWTHRLMMEALCHEKNSFVTLTYSDDELDKRLVNNGKDGFSVSITETQGFLKRLRDRISPERIRFYAVGEYGDKSYRPHYHVAIFGKGCSCKNGSCTQRKKDIIRTKLKDNSNDKADFNWYSHVLCEDCYNIEKAWQGRGFVDIGELNPQSSGYLCGYVLKKLFKEKEKLEALGLWPEFAHGSKGIGKDYVDTLVEMVLAGGDAALTDVGDVPYSLLWSDTGNVSLRNNNYDDVETGLRSLPLGRYIRQKLREALCMEEAYDEITGEIKYVSKEAQSQNWQKEMQDLFKNAKDDKTLSEDAKVSLKHFIKEKYFAENNHLEKSMKINQRSKSI
jgi:hypothetical protein